MDPYRSFCPPHLTFFLKVKSIELFDEIKAFLEYPFYTVSLLGFLYEKYYYYF